MQMQSMSCRSKYIKKCIDFFAFPGNGIRMVELDIRSMLSEIAPLVCRNPFKAL